jgi:polyhydroxybutyrate depolymerase
MADEQASRVSSNFFIYGGMSLLAFIVAVVLIAAASEGDWALPPSHTVEILDDQRFFDLRLPEANDAAHPAPLLLVLHSGSGSASRTEYITGLTEIAVPQGYIVVYPEGLDGDWNDGRSGSFSRATRESVDDVAFLDTVVDKVAEHHHVDRNRIFITGHGGGGMMALRYACERSDRVAAVAVVDALLPEEAGDWCRTRSSVPALFIVQRESPTVPFDGGPVEHLRLQRGRVLGAIASARYWAAANGCNAEALPGPGGPGILESWRFTGCGPRAEVTLLAIDGKYLDFPGGRIVRTMQYMTGEPSTFETIPAILEFLQAHAREDKPAGE